MAVISAQDVASSGGVPTYAAATVSGDSFLNDGKTFIHVKAGAAGTLNVTIAGAVTCDQGSTHNTVVNVATNSEKMIGPFPTTRYNDASGYVTLAYSQVTNVTIGVFQV